MTANAFERESLYFFHTYERISLEFERGEGVYLYTKDGKRYLDMFSGLAVNALGYGHPKVILAITEQAQKYIHLSNYYLQEPQLRLAELLVKYSNYAKIFFCNSGTEGIEGAIKIARKWGTKQKKVEIVSFTNAFHGRTMGALSMMDRPRYRQGYEPFLEHFLIIPFNDIDALQRTVSHKTAAVVLEFIQGESGIVPATPEFVDKLHKLKQQFGFLLIADEIQCGLGRTGKLFGFQHYSIDPDMVVIAKPLGGGLPLGAVLGNNTVADVLEPGEHGSTFGGNPVACAAGCVVLEELIENRLMSNASTMGELLKTKLVGLRENFPLLVKDVRGYGLMVGMELHRDAEPIVVALRERQILLNCTNQRVLRFLPPLIITEKHVEETVRALRQVFNLIQT